MKSPIRYGFCVYLVLCVVTPSACLALAIDPVCDRLDEAIERLSVSVQEQESTLTYIGSLLIPEASYYDRGARGRVASWWSWLRSLAKAEAKSRRRYLLSQSLRQVLAEQVALANAYVFLDITKLFLQISPSFYLTIEQKRRIARDYVGVVSELESKIKKNLNKITLLLVSKRPTSVQLSFTHKLLSENMEAQKKVLNMVNSAKTMLKALCIGPHHLRQDTKEGDEDKDEWVLISLDSSDND